MTNPDKLLIANLDLESTGLDPELDEIWEVALILTDSYYNTFHTIDTLVRPTEAGYQRFLAGPAVVIDMHTKSGLLAALNAQPWDELPTLAEVEQQILAALDKYNPHGFEVALGGGGVAHYDHPTITVQMPALAERLTYWDDDVSAARRSYARATKKDIIGTAKSDKQHRALADIKEDVAASRAFRQLYINSVKPRADESGADRSLSGLTLIEAFNDSRAFAAGDAAIYTADTADTIHTMLRTTDPTNVIFGLMDVASTLLTRLATATGTTERALVNDFRETLLEAIATTSDTSSGGRA